MTDHDRIACYSVVLGRMEDAGKIHMGLATSWARMASLLWGISYADALGQAVEILERGFLLPRLITASESFDSELEL